MREVTVGVHRTVRRFVTEGSNDKTDTGRFGGKNNRVAHFC